MKIVIIGPNVGMGGVERASTNIANGFKNAGHDVTYLALIPEAHFFELQTNYVEPKNFNVAKMSLSKTIKYVRRNIIELQPDHIIAYTKFYAAIANLALIFTKYKIYVSERSSPLYIWPRHIELFSKLSFFLRRPKGIISQTSLASEYHQKLYGKTKYAVIPNALRDIQLYPEIKREKIILAVGRFNDPCKGFDLLIEAFNQLENEEWHLVFAGGKKEEADYLMSLANTKVASRIEFLGHVKNMDQIYARAGIFVIPSRSEGFPNSLIEAMAAGCPSISFDFIAGPRDIIQNGENGILVEKENYELLAKEMDNLIKDETLRHTLGSNASKIQTNLNSNKIIEKYLDFIN
tara:strand:+ start:21173 stop:22219 length:1047 start_codon:yes stop_codon:yes gene_type:complete